MKSKHTIKEDKVRSYNNWRIRKTLFHKRCDNDNNIDDKKRRKKTKRILQIILNKKHTSIHTIGIYSSKRSLTFLLSLSRRFKTRNGKKKSFILKDVET